MGNLLCSLLLGRNYNAYNVYGYATDEVTLRVMRRIECPFLVEKSKEEEAVDTGLKSKYALTPPKDLKSKFLQSMAQKEIDKKRREVEKEEEEMHLRQLELEQPPPDPLYGKRIHGWVLILPRDEKDESKPFFIEPTTGMRREIDHHGYCSIQSVWNNMNYWVNLQDDSVGVGNLDYNLANLDKWEHLLAGEPIWTRKHAVNYDEMEDEDEDAAELKLIMDEKHLDMPEPWSLRINVPISDVVRRFPKGSKKTWYKKTIVEEYSPYIQTDGLVMKVYNYSDLDWTDLLSIEERFEHRNDKLMKRTEECNTGLITEYFDLGRDDNCKKHNYYKSDNHLESWRRLEYYFKSRFDCLHFIDHGELYLKEDYVDREDKFYHRHTVYAKRGEPPPGFLEGPRRIVKNVVEHFQRNPLKKASDDIATREFDFLGRKMNLKFHYEKGKITASTRTFLKPPLTEMVEGVSFKPELTHGYNAEIGAKPPKNSTLYSLLEKLLKDEDECNIKINHVEDAISEFLRVRNLENLHPKLDVGLFNREQNQEQRVAMLEKERLERTKKEREIEEELDFIQPYLVKFNCPEVLKFHHAQKVRDQCLLEFKELLLRRANDLQKQFTQQIEYIAAKHNWYTSECDNLIYEVEQAYFKDMNQAQFVLNLLDIRLQRHKDLAPARFRALVQFLELHPKLQILKPRKKT